MDGQHLKIYFTSDIHGYLFPTTYGSRDEKEMGLLNCSYQFKKDGNTLILDGGDSLQGSPMAYYCSKNKDYGYPVAQVMNRVGYDYFTIGNHDFNYGYEYLGGYLRELEAQCLCANVIDRSGALPIFPSAVKVLKNGIRVGLIGITTDYVKVWEQPEHMKNFIVMDPFERAREELGQLRLKADVLIGLYHGGFECDLVTDEILSHTTENTASRICRELDFDLLLTGHQHMALEGAVVHGTYVVQTPANGTAYIEIDLDRSPEGWEINSKLCTAGKFHDPGLADMLRPLEEQVQKWLDEPIGFLGQPLIPDEHLAMALHGSGIADFFNQVQLEATGAQISCTSLANEVRGFDQEVTVRDVVSTYLFPNTLTVLEVSGSVLKAALERAAEYFDVDEEGIIRISERFLKPKVEHYNYDYYAGVGYIMDVSRPLGERVISLTCRGEAVRPDGKYSLCLNSYRSSGAGGYEMFRGSNILAEGSREMPEIIIDYFLKHHTVVIGDNRYYKIIAG